MKIFLTALVLVLFSVASFAETATVPVEGMTCSSCVEHVTSSFKKAGYENVVVKLEEKIAIIELPAGKKTADADLQAVVTKAGYTPGKVVRK